ncbi:MAG: ABC-type Fe3+-hydroxamate transport system, periplasmic component [Paenibacillaceae bacterium]|jgi:iron complex transport system substrate-binding protein|nr:ABC-type Fe3+-hydroxamate transport system, periplasmic component [Paenibacillaceae bacterium]
MKKSLSGISPTVLSLILAASLLAACGSSSQDQGTSAAGATVNATTGATSTAASGSSSIQPSPSAAASQSPAATYIFTDSAGRQVELPKNVKKIAPSGQLAQMVLFALAPDKLVGLSNKWSQDSGTYLDSKYLSLPVFGQFYGSANLNKEALAAAAPEIIIDIGEKKSSIVDDMDSVQKQLGIPTIFIEATLATMSSSYETLGQVLGMPQEAKVLSDYCKEIYTNTTETMKTIGDKKVKVLYSLGDTGTNVIAKGSFHAEVLDLMGDNVAVIDNPSSKGTGNEVSLEQIVQWKPDVILFAPQSFYSKAAADGTWKQMKAIAEGKFYEVPATPYNWLGSPPSINRYIGMVWLSQLLYPDAFHYDMKQEVNRFYKLFYHSKDLTDEQYKSLTQYAVK